MRNITADVRLRLRSLTSEEVDWSLALSPRGIHDLAEMVDVRYRVLRGDPERVAGTDSRRSISLRASKTAA